MKTLIVFYSRTGTTKKVAQALAQKLAADAEEIRDKVDRSGIIGYMKSGRDAMKGKLTELEPVAKDPAGYDLVIIGTPNWGRHISAGVRTYLTEQKEKIKKTAFFCTQGGSGDDKVFAEMKNVLGKDPTALLTVSAKEAAKGEFEEKLDKFITQLK